MLLTRHQKNLQTLTDEDRWITLGLTDGQHYLVVIHTYRDEQDDTITIRLISARDATKHEIAHYQG